MLEQKSGLTCRFWAQSRCRCDRRRWRGGFSLLELLVAVAAVAALTAMVLPSMGRAKELTRRVVCSANLRNLGLGLKSYGHEHRGRYPVEELCGNPQPVLTRSLFPTYVCSRELFYCPSADQIERYAQSDEYCGPGGDSIINTDENWARSHISYKYFSVTRRDPRMPLPLLRSEYPHLLSVDLPAGRWLMSDWVRKDAPVFPHWEEGGWGGGRNVLFADISVRFVRHRTQCAFGER